jgi:uncharacterized alkaline shock family protein YloU
MRIYALVGTSGTGKSYKALGLASERKIQHIIDDGLFINSNKVLAGISAKQEHTKLSAVKRALFIDDDHALAVKRAITLSNPESILVLGTSIEMIERIVERLDLPPISEIISIENIATDREIRLAKKYRKEQGKHVIPVPTFEIRKAFSGYFIDTLKSFKVEAKGRKLETIEKTVVRPTYSYLGKFYISDSVIKSIAVYSAANVEGIHRVLKVDVVSANDGILINMDMSVIYGRRIVALLEEVQRFVVRDIDVMTGMNVLAVNVAAKSIVVYNNAR